MLRYILVLAVVLNIFFLKQAFAQTDGGKVVMPAPSQNNGQNKVPSMSDSAMKVEKPLTSSDNGMKNGGSAPMNNPASDSSAPNVPPILTPALQNQVVPPKPMAPVISNSTTYSNPDYSLLEKLANSLNKKKFEDFSAVFSKDFEFITNKDKSIKAMDDLRKFWDELFASKSIFETANFTMTPGKIISPVQGFANVVIPYKLTAGSETFDGVISIVMKLEQDAWKISEMQMSSHSLAAYFANKQAISKCAQELEEYKKSTMGLMFPAFLGFIIGIAVMYFYRSTKKPVV